MCTCVHVHTYMCVQREGLTFSRRLSQMTSAVLYKMSSAGECAVRGILQNLPSAALGGSLLSQKALRVVYSAGPELPAWGAQPGIRKPGQPTVRLEQGRPLQP